MNYEEYLIHFNPNHDPRNGQFTTSSNGSAKTLNIKQNRNTTNFSSIIGYNTINSKLLLGSIEAGAAVLATLAIAYGGAKLYKSGMISAYASAGQRLVDTILGKSAGNEAVNLFDKLKGSIPPTIPIGKVESLNDTLKKTNPNFNKNAYANNCTSCSLAAFLRTIGLDANAKGFNGRSNKITFIEECFKIDEKNGILGGYSTEMSKSADVAAKMLKLKFGDNASGIIGIDFKTIEENAGSAGHAFNWRIVNGNVEFFDAQNPNGIRNDWWCRAYIWNKIKEDGVFLAYRLDNAEPIINGILKYIE